jgi:hypothetical protein
VKLEKNSRNTLGTCEAVKYYSMIICASDILLEVLCTNISIGKCKLLLHVLCGVLKDNIKASAKSLFGTGTGTIKSDDAYRIHG